MKNDRLNYLLCDLEECIRRLDELQEKCEDNLRIQELLFDKTERLKKEITKCL